MTTAFVLGGGGALGAVEVGMLAALLERDVRPDLVLGTSVGAINGAFLAQDPGPDVVERLTGLWRSVAANRHEVYGDRPLRSVRRAVATGTHLYSARPLTTRLREEIGDVDFADLAVPLQVCAASIERAAEHWFDSGPVVDAVVASAAVPGLLPPARVGDEHFLDGGIVNSVPVARAHQLGATRIFVLQIGRVDRPLHPPRRPWAGSSGRELAALPPEGEAHVLPARGTAARDDSVRAGTDFRDVERRIELTRVASGEYLDALGRPDPG